MAANILQHRIGRLGRFVNGVVFGKQNLLLTNCLISTAMGALGDSVQQHYDLITARINRKNHVENRKAESHVFCWKRTAHMSAAGFTTGLVSHYWYILLDKKLGSARTLGVTCKKVLWDQILFSPVNLVVYFSTLGLLEASSPMRVKDEIIEKGLQQIYVAEWLIWPPAQFFNFMCLPLKYRILFDNIISFGFDIYSPYVKYKTQLKKEKQLQSGKPENHLSDVEDNNHVSSDN